MAASSGGRRVVGLHKNVQDAFRLGAARVQGQTLLLSLSTRPPAPSHPQAKPILCILGPLCQSLMMYFKGPRAIALRPPPPDPKRPGEITLPASPSCQPPHWGHSSLGYCPASIWLKCNVPE